MGLEEFKSFRHFRNVLVTFCMSMSRIQWTEKNLLFLAFRKFAWHFYIDRWSKDNDINMRRLPSLLQWRANFNQNALFTFELTIIGLWIDRLTKDRILWELKKIHMIVSNMTITCPSITEFKTQPLPFEPSKRIKKKWMKREDLWSGQIYRYTIR